jgi:hypothetical protein
MLCEYLYNFRVWEVAKTNELFRELTVQIGRSQFTIDTDADALNETQLFVNIFSDPITFP